MSNWVCVKYRQKTFVIQWLTWWNFFVLVAPEMSACHISSSSNLVYSCMSWKVTKSRKVVAAWLSYILAVVKIYHPRTINAIYHPQPHFHSKCKFYQFCILWCNISLLLIHQSVESMSMSYSKLLITPTKSWKVWDAVKFNIEASSVSAQVKWTRKD